MEHPGDLVTSKGSAWNDTYYPVDEIIVAAWITFTLVALLLVLMVVIIFSNCFVIALYVRDPHLRVPTNTFIFMLCVCDLMVGLNIPLVVASTVNPTMWNGTLWCAYKCAMVTLFIFISLHLQVAIAFDRLIAIAKPFHYVKIVSVRCSFLTSMACFIYCVGVFFILPILWSNREEYCFIWRTMKTAYKLAVATPHYIILFSLLLFCYIRIFRVARKACHQRPPQVNICPSPGGAIVTLETEMKAARTLVLVVGLIFVTWFPYFLSFFLFHIGDETPALVHFATVVTHLPYLNSAWNPWIYAIRLPAFRKSFRRVLRKRSRTRSSIGASASETSADVIPTSSYQRGSLPM